MATLPRMHASKNASMSSPFSTSPRKLQEMTLPLYDGNDITMASGVSMKQYEDQLNSLKKENFHLKLRIYFLEEKLGTGAPPAVQGLLEHNVRLQVEVEELRRQLADKQELLAAAAEAIDVLEQQGSISTDSVEASMNQDATKKYSQNEDQSNLQLQQTCNETQQESESAVNLGTSIDAERMNELLQLRRENRKALQMIKSCMKKIQQQNKEIKKIKLDKELVYAQVSDSQLEKYEEIVKSKDEHIRDLEERVRELQEGAGGAGDAGNLQELLTRRLQGLAFFLDKLLSHKCVLGEDKKKLAESILKQSLALPVGLKLNESMAPEDFTMDESNLSQSMRLEDLTIMFGHHVNCDGGGGRGAARKAGRARAEPLSESECWSEPDRTVSLARMGLREARDTLDAAATRSRARRSRLSHLSHGSRTEDKTLNDDAALFEEIALLNKHLEESEIEKNCLIAKLRAAKQQIDDLLTERNSLNEVVAAERRNVIDANKVTAELTQKVLIAESEQKELSQKLASASAVAERLRAERAEAESTFQATEVALRRAADEATLQASQAALDRARAQQERLRAERELDMAREQLAAAQEAEAQRLREAARLPALAAHQLLHEPPLSEEDRPTSPDQGIDSDRLSSLEQNDIQLSPRSLYKENVTLKQKLARSKATLTDALAQLNAANSRKNSVQRAICRQIHETEGVLRMARGNMENQK